MVDLLISPSLFVSCALTCLHCTRGERVVFLSATVIVGLKIKSLVCRCKSQHNFIAIMNAAEKEIKLPFFLGCNVLDIFFSLKKNCHIHSNFLRMSDNIRNGCARARGDLTQKNASLEEAWGEDSSRFGRQHPEKKLQLKILQEKSTALQREESATECKFLPNAERSSLIFILPWPRQYEVYVIRREERWEENSLKVFPPWTEGRGRKRERSNRMYLAPATSGPAAQWGGELCTFRTY